MKYLWIIPVIIVIAISFIAGFNLAGKVDTTTIPVTLTQTQTVVGFETVAVYPSPDMTITREVIVYHSLDYVTSGNCTDLLVNGIETFTSVILPSSTLTGYYNATVYSTTSTLSASSYTSGYCTVP